MLQHLEQLKPVERALALVVGEVDLEAALEFDPLLVERDGTNSMFLA